MSSLLERRRADSSYNVLSWQYMNDATLSDQDIRQLLINRGEKAENLSDDRQKSVELLHRKYYVYLAPKRISKLSSEALVAELRLHGSSDRYTRIRRMITRLNNDITAKVSSPCIGSSSSLLRTLKYVFVLQFPSWTQLEEKHPFKIQGRYRPTFSHAMKANRSDKQETLVLSDCENMYKFNAKTTSWQKWLSYPLSSDATRNPLVSLGTSESNKTIHPYLQTLCIDTKRGNIYFFERTYRLLLRLESDTQTVHRVNTKGIKATTNRWSMEAATFAEDQLHVFAITKTLTHFVLNEEANELEEVHAFSNTKYCVADLRYLSRKRKLLLFVIEQRYRGGIYYGNGYCGGTQSMSLYSYCMIKQKYSKLPILFPPRMLDYKYGMVTVRNPDEYIIIYPKEGNNLYVVDMESKRLLHCHVQCPKVTTWAEAMIVDSMHEHELITFGYVRDCWRKYAIGLNRFPPQYLIHLIASWYLNGDDDYLYLLEGAPAATQWRIRVGSIVNNLAEECSK